MAVVGATLLNVGREKNKKLDDGVCCAQDNNFSEESTNQAETDAARDVPNAT